MSKDCVQICVQTAIFHLFSFLFSLVQVGLRHAGGRPRSGWRHQAATGPQPAEGKHSGAAQPQTGRGEPEAERGAAAHHDRVTRTRTAHDGLLAQLGCGDVKVWQTCKHCVAHCVYTAVCACLYELVGLLKGHSEAGLVVTLAKEQNGLTDFILNSMYKWVNGCWIVVPEC